jgi:hypothetical protein
MAMSATTVAKQLLDDGPGGLEELHIHEFTGDEESHDDEAVEALYAEFGAEFDRTVAGLTREYGSQSRLGNEDDEVVPLNGVLRFVVWTVGDAQLFLAIAHEHRGVPILLMLGTAGDESQ